MKVSILLILTFVQLCSSQPVQRLNSHEEIKRDLFVRVSSVSSVRDSRIELFDDADKPGRKNPTLAVVYSLLLPGMGELYAGNYNAGKYFTIAEGGLLVALGSVQWYANWLQHDARGFAVQHAHVIDDGKSDQYFVDIGAANNVYDFNEAILRLRDINKTYDPNSAYAWAWDTEPNRARYRDLRVTSDEMFNNVRFVVAVMAVNNLVSAINAGRLVISHNKSIEESGLLDIHANLLGPITRPDGMMISVSKNF